MGKTVLTQKQREQLLEQAEREFEGWKQKGLSLNMARGKPGLEQLELSRGLFSVLNFDDCMDKGVDARNYGELAGAPCAREYWAELLNIKPEQCIVGGNSSLAMMYDLIAKAWSNGLLHSPLPWSREERVKFLCPAPGYDRHFRITQSFGIELISIPMTGTGPDMDCVTEWITDPTVKGMWCVPKFSNPDGIVYSLETMEKIACMQSAAPDFVVIWDHAYCVHEFRAEYQELPDILSLCSAAGNPDRVFEFASTSKMTIPGAGMAVLASSLANVEHMLRLMSAQMISYDKVNQLRQVHFLKNKQHTLSLMKEHAHILRPKFDAFLLELERQIRPLELADWSNPSGGYFISLYTMRGCAKRTVALCKEAGLIMTDAGAAYPYGVDPEDRHIRIAPSYPALQDVELAAKVFCTCLKLASLERMQGED